MAGFIKPVSGFNKLNPYEIPTRGVGYPRPCAVGSHSLGIYSIRIRQRRNGCDYMNGQMWIRLRRTAHRNKMKIAKGWFKWNAEFMLDDSVVFGRSSDRPPYIGGGSAVKPLGPALTESGPDGRTRRATVLMGRCGFTPWARRRLR